MVGDAPLEFFTSRTFYAPYEIWTQKGSMHFYPELVMQVKADGHFIGSHTTHHAWFHWPWLMSKASIEQEFEDWEQIAGGLNLQPKLFRAPYLIDSENLREVARQRGYQIIRGTTVGDASPGSTVEDIKQNILQILRRDTLQGQPKVLIFHDVFPLTYEHLGEIIDYVQQQGYQLVDFDPVRLSVTPVTQAPMGAEAMEHHLITPTPTDSAVAIQPH
jgi:peptidoglycan/xylan/chitin deacetylase (PgdA/CDA1 family)